jgi:DNA repair protein RadC
MSDTPSSASTSNGTPDDLESAASATDGPASDAADAASEEDSPSITYQRPICEWDPDDRPREKLVKHGAAKLSEAELLGMLFGTGTRTSDGPVSAIQLGRSLLHTFKTLHALSRRPLKELMRVSGIGLAKASTLMAAFEIARRIDAKGDGERVQVTSPKDVAEYFGPLMRDLKREVFKVAHLNTANVIIAEYTISEGGLASSIVEPRAVFEQAILDNAASVICLHNHPSGNPEPSREDIRVTRQLVEAGRLMGIPVHDHLIIAGTTFTSLAERGIIG